MKIRILILAVILLLSLQINCIASDRYQWILSTDENNFWLDTETIKFSRDSLNNNVNKDIADFWIKITYTDDGLYTKIESRKNSNLSTVGYENLGFTINHSLLNAKSKKLALLAYIDYDNKGKVLSSKSWSPEWFDITPGSAGEEIDRSVSNFIINNFTTIFSRS
ncbi:hypothetical protein [Sporomusa aerivorans]|uniref:hypothetical protein n=1 Tax=Sporomusa aerivorans TaxID=204936 RepID=UPI00352BC0A1